MAIGRFFARDDARAVTTRPSGAYIAVLLHDGRDLMSRPMTTGPPTSANISPSHPDRHGHHNGCSTAPQLRPSRRARIGKANAHQSASQRRTSTEFQQVSIAWRVGWVGKALLQVSVWVTCWRFWCWYVDVISDGHHRVLPQEPATSRRSS